MDRMIEEEDERHSRKLQYSIGATRDKMKQYYVTVYTPI
jgi:hypothetical protein